MEDGEGREAGRGAAEGRTGEREGGREGGRKERRHEGMEGGTCYLLPVQELHERPQHVVGVGLHRVVAAGVDGAFDLVQQGGHLPHAVIDTTLETTAEMDRESSTRSGEGTMWAPVLCLCVPCTVPVLTVCVCVSGTCSHSVCVCVLPVSKRAAQLLQHSVQFDLQLVQEVASLVVQLQTDI